MRTRVYETKNLGKGKRMVTSRTLGEDIIHGIFWLIIILPCKIIWYVCTWPFYLILHIVKKIRSR